MESLSHPFHHPCASRSVCRQSQSFNPLQVSSPAEGVQREDKAINNTIRFKYTRQLSRPAIPTYSHISSVDLLSSHLDPLGTHDPPIDLLKSSLHVSLLLHSPLIVSCIKTSRDHERVSLICSVSSHSGWLTSRSSHEGEGLDLESTWSITCPSLETRLLLPAAPFLTTCRMGGSHLARRVSLLLRRIRRGLSNLCSWRDIISPAHGTSLYASKRVLRSGHFSKGPWPRTSLSYDLRPTC